jgi:L-ascorbate metabolism protein UlaG (beta-lactamase superfamily)
MAAKITWWGHGTWSVETGGQRIVIDPFFDDSPTSPTKSEQVAADYLLISHGHFDHVADAAKIATRTGAVVVSNYEICEWLTKQGVAGDKTQPMNLGGAITLPFGQVKSTLAFHSSQLPDGSYGGNPGGFLLKLPEGNIYFACDTGLFGDMRLIGAAGLALAVIPVGDRFTMGPDDALEAVKLLNPKKVVPSHYGTWPPIQQDVAAWAQRVRAETKSEPIVIEPGQSISL